MAIDYSTLLLEFRTEMGWSQAELAKSVGVSQAMISAIELKGRQPSRAVEHKIFEALGKYALTAAHFLNKHNPIIRERIALLVDKSGGCEHVAGLLGVTAEDVLAWKRGTKTLEGPAFDKMVDVFNVAPEWLDGLGDNADIDVEGIETPTGGRRIRILEDRVAKLEHSRERQKDTAYVESLTIEEQGIIKVYRSLPAPDKFDFIGVVNEYRGRLGQAPKAKKKATGTQQLSA
jgi:DNA-binding XRE family transcriptional regulator